VVNATPRPFYPPGKRPGAHFYRRLGGTVWTCAKGLAPTWSGSPNYDNAIAAYKIQTPGNYQDESIQHSQHGESLKSRIPSAMVRETDKLMLYREIIAVCSEIHTKHINTLCGQNVELYIKTQSVPRSKHRLVYKNQSVNSV
jgi:hypothetical protein